MRYQIVGANKETGDDVDVVLDAPSHSEVEKLAHERGILVSAITALPPAPPPPATHAARIPATPTAAAAASQAPAAASRAPGASRAGGTAVGVPAAAPAHHSRQKNEDLSAISLIDDDPPADPKTPKAERAHGMITVNANSPSETAHTGAGQIDHGKLAETPMEYHVILNQSLFLLESAVNKHLRDGWEPSGALSVGVSNNALQFFQSMIRRKKPDAKPPETPKAEAPH